MVPLALLISGGVAFAPRPLRPPPITMGFPDNDADPALFGLAFMVASQGETEPSAAAAASATAGVFDGLLPAIVLRIGELLRCRLRIVLGIGETNDRRAAHQRESTTQY